MRAASRLRRSLLLACALACAAGLPIANAGDDAPAPRFRDAPLLPGPPWIADPSAHVFAGRIYIYGSHDVDEPARDGDSGNQFVMRDYRVLSMDRIGGTVTVHPVALALADVPWASQQLWAPDAAERDGRYYLYFPAKDKHGVFRIGVAVGDRPEGPFKPQPKPIRGSYSIDPSVFGDDDGAHYLLFGGIWGGQLQRWKTGKYDPAGGDTDLQRPDAPALMPRIARLRKDMLEFAEPPRELQILDASGKPLSGGDTARRFFEAAWMHKHDGRYYLSWSTGDTHTIRYAIGDSPYGPFIERGIVLPPVQGWTNHHSIVQVEGTWHLFYHDTQLSGRDHLRNAKVTELVHQADGSIRVVDAFVR